MSVRGYSSVTQRKFLTLILNVRICLILMRIYSSVYLYHFNMFLSVYLIIFIWICIQEKHFKVYFLIKSYLKLFSGFLVILNNTHVIKHLINWKIKIVIKKYNLTIFQIFKILGITKIVSWNIIHSVINIHNYEKQYILSVIKIGSIPNYPSLTQPLFWFLSWRLEFPNVELHLSVII